MQPGKWKKLLQNAEDQPERILKMLAIKENEVSSAQAALEQFPARVPATLLSRMVPGDANDPLFLQVFPQAEEDHDTSGYSLDPLEESDSQPVPGLLHKYQRRALLIVTGACAVHCRYCFRRHFPYQDLIASRGKHWHRVLDYLSSRTEINEIILSGGDPLTLTDQRINDLLDQLSAIPHLQRVRVHTRIPVVLPERITERLVNAFEMSRLSPVFVIHSNHAGEIGESARVSIAKLADSGIMLFNQTVLLRGINDSVESLVDLSETLFNAGVIPYYLHLLDKVQGAAHFQVSLARAHTIMDELRAALPGYLVPRLVAEIPGRPSKVPAELLPL